MEDHKQEIKGLPGNAYRELKPGEEYKPVMPAHKTVPEVNLRSVLLGLLMAVIFSAAAAYLGLKIGQVFEAAIPIAIIAVGLSTVSKRKNALGENVIIQSIGASSGVIVAGAIFTLPALYILNLEAHFYQVFLSSLLGGFLGILFLIPFRKYFVSEMHGKYPFPEATATTEVLVSGEKGGSQARLLLVAGLIGGIYDFIIATFGWWSEVFTSRVIPAGEMIADKFKIVFKMNVGAAVMGLGYIIGLKYAAIIAAGSFIGWYVLIPVISHFADGQTIAVGANVTALLADMSPEEIFRNYVRQIGIGGIAMAGVIGIIRSSGIIRSAFGLAFKELGGKQAMTAETKRTQRDIPMKIILFGIVITAIVIFVFFWAGVVNNLTQALIALAIVMIIAFLFTTVAANAIAIVGTNPVSGMTLMTLIITSLVLVWAGLSGTAGMVAALIIGGVVCTALSMAGGFITDLKIGYWLGSSPYKQESWKFLGTLVSAATVGGVIMILNKTYGFTGEGALVAPQANAMAAVIEPMMSGKPAPWMLYAGGAFMSLILTMIGVPALAFALGMFIPIELNTPLLVGGIIAWYVTTRSKNEGLNQARKERGTLIASGFIAGGALMGVISAMLKFGGINFVNAEWFESHTAEALGLLMFAIICGYMIWEAMRASKAEAEFVDLADTLEEENHEKDG
ncbi:MAG: oligopeptide transporter, OPT family [Lentimicrobium sp.]|jgi:putative OPT family oligopeptide transporter|nr:oligopeptide transporter, OPT family [Lentimicrobium sp.]MDD2528743.1 oligopeptide transporter, OPT family [Lentimicrobiaceae bacterium]MDD4599141.1 oligopeptide transporter, OPT family [Lentimicrobiaceae bacterium]MDY0025331.1 oligopeptide transporter, OPT family [Lentimicrobium sp.]HAH57074.1 oligopeptide transporter, OPT family [Bacteroidales bacterium]